MENNSNNNMWTLMNLDTFLDSLGFDPITTLLATFILPVINLLGLLFCALSFYIFLQRTFLDPSFFYYRLLCLVNILHLIHNLAHLLLYSPHYFPNMNTYLSSMYQIYSTFILGLFFHFEGVIQMAILLDRIKLYSPFVKRYFVASPRIVSLTFFLTCFLIDLPIPFASRISSIGTYYNNDLKQNETFYYIASSSFSTTSFGRILFAFTAYFLNIFLTLVVGVGLNIFSVYLYSSYLRQRKLNIDQTNRISYNNFSASQQASTSREVDIRVLNETIITIPRLNSKQRKERELEKTMFYMALTLCLISILSRTVILINYISYVFFSPSFRKSLLIFISNAFMFTIVPTLAIFVFYLFNKMFRREFHKKFLRRETESTHGSNQ